MDDMTVVTRGVPNWKVVGPDSLTDELPKLDHPELMQYFHNFLVNRSRTGDVPQLFKVLTIEALHKN